MLVYALVVIIILWALYTGGMFYYNRWSLNKYATVLDNLEFDAKITGQQLIDIREPNVFKSKHILGARNIQAAMLLQATDAIRSDRPVYLYDDRGLTIASVVRKLHKAGFDNIYVLKGGFATWTGKTKVSAF